MLIVHDTFFVVIGKKGKAEKPGWRISRPNLEEFIHICLFNGYDHLLIEKEGDLK